MIPERGMSSARRHARIRRAVVGCVCLSAVLLSLPARAADPKADGLEALKQKDYTKAYDFFLQAAEVTKGKDEEKETADLLFYLGLARQKAAEQTGAGEARPGLLGEAATYYNQALGLNPKSSSTLNNLAQVYVAQGSTKLAEETLTKAIALGDAEQAFHMQNYAALQESDGNWKEACRYYALASWAQPDNPAPLHKLIDLCLEHDRALVGFYLWDMTERGQVLQAQKTALSVLSKPGWSQTQKDELLAIVATSLSKQSYDPRKFAETEIAKDLGTLSDETLAEGGREILLLHRPDQLRPDAFPWWKEKYYSSKRPARGKWPLEAFQDLTRSLGEYHKTHKETEIAVKYLQLAMKMAGFLPDLPALTSLADLYARTDQEGELRKLLESEEGILFSEKSRAYEEGKLNEIYSLHVALGSIYSSLGQWGTSSQPTSAIFQLEHAMKIAQESQRRSDATPIELNPALVDRLASGYQKTNQATKEFEVRLDAAEELQKAGRHDAAEEVFAPLRRTSPPDRLKVRYLQIEPMLEGGSPTSGGDRSGLTRVRVSAGSQSVQDQRERQRLSKGEVSAIQESVGDLVGKGPARTGPGRAVRVLPANGGAVPKGVKEINVEGNRGRVLLERNAKLVEVPFSIDTKAPEEAASVRYIKP